jgi:hypothetical protein
LGIEVGAEKQMQKNSNHSSWADYLDEFKPAARRSSALAVARDRLIATARGVLKQPLVRRVYRFEDIGRHRTWLDGRARPLKEPMHSIFALAMSDHGTNQLLSAELPTVAAAARLTGDRRLVQRVHDQLHEMASWSPLQRPGWCAYGDRLPPDGKDGNWLATGTGVRAIADTLEILGRDTLPPATVARLDQLLAAEIVSIVDDWTAKRPWFIYGNAPFTNQWVLPTEGLIRACLVLGRDRHTVAYEQGVANLFAHLNFHGSQGAFEEGIHYADFTLQSLMSVARAMALAGDRRAIDHPFLRHFPLWALHHFQPGGFVINAFDAFGAARGNRALMKNTCALAAVSLASRDALWAMDHLTDGPDDSVAGLVSRIMVRRTLSPPKLFAAYARAARINWRSSWDAKATGIWVRGGDRFDSHDHQDRGHVNVILQGIPVFIEAGTPAYHNPRLSGDYASGRGHNVLQLGNQPPLKKGSVPVVPAGWQKIRAVAPITVHRLTARGGDLVVDGTAGYDGLKRWRRQVTWTLGQVEVDDTVQLANAQPQVVLFRWHLGLTRNPRMVIEKNGVCVRWPGIQVSMAADSPLDIAIEPMPDHTLCYRKWDDQRPDHLHACLVVKTASPVKHCRITTLAQLTR